VVLLLSSCTTTFRNVRIFELNGNDPKALVTIHEDFCSSLGYLDSKGRLHVIRAQLDALGELGQILFSPSQQKVVVESYGEGHQYLSIYVIRDLIQERCGGTEFIRAYRTLDPYPYGFRDIRWLTDDCIQFSAKADMTQFDRELRRGKAALDDGIDLPHLWKWHLETDTFERIGSQ